MGLWAMGYGHGALGMGHWSLGYGHWDMGYGHWAMVIGNCQRKTSFLFSSDTYSGSQAW